MQNDQTAATTIPHEVAADPVLLEQRIRCVLDELAARTADEPWPLPQARLREVLRQILAEPVE